MLSSGKQVLFFVPDFGNVEGAPVKTLLSCLFLSCILLAFVGGAWALKWESLGRHPLGEMYIETEQVERNGDKVTYWGRRVYSEKQPSVKRDFWYTDQRVRHEIDCKARTVAITGMILMDETGKVWLEDLKMRQDPKPIEPGGFIVKGAERFCAVPTASPEPAKPKDEANW